MARFHFTDGDGDSAVLVTGEDMTMHGYGPRTARPVVAILEVHGIDVRGIESAAVFVSPTNAMHMIDVLKEALER